MRSSDLMRVAKAAMRMDCDDDAWLAGTCRAFKQTRPQACGATGYRFELGQAAVVLGASFNEGAAAPDMHVDGLAAINDAQRKRIYGSLATATTATREFGGRLPAPLAAAWGRLGIQDVFGIIAALSDGTGVLVGTVESQVVGEADVRQGQALVGTLKRSLMLRQALAGAPLDQAVSAIFDVDGTPEAVAPGVRAVELRAVREIVRQREAARRRAERDDLSAWQVWQGLCAGRYRLVDYVDRDGKHFVVLVEDEEGKGQALTSTERRIAELCGRAWGNKQIGYELGLTETSVANHVGRVLAKLGLDHRVELVRLYTGCERVA